MKTKIIKISEEYTNEPAGRYYSDGKFSGERFRKEFLVDALNTYEKVIVDFDGTEGTGSSFLEEAFGGLVHELGFASTKLHEQLELISNEDGSVINEVWSYIDNATPKVKNAK